MIEGKLVNLRAPEMADLDRNQRWINDREVTRFLVIRYPMSMLAEEAWLRGVSSKAGAYDSAFFAIETKEGEHIGNTNFFAGVPEARHCELGIMIGDKRHWSRGFGTDAVRTLVGFGFEEMNLNRIELNVYGLNSRAQAAYRKAGFVEEGRLREAVFAEGTYDDLIIMSVLRVGWRADGA